MVNDFFSTERKEKSSVVMTKLKTFIVWTALQKMSNKSLYKASIRLLLI